MLNLCLREKMKKVFVIMTTAGITLVNAGCVSGCEKQNDDDFMQPGGYSSDVDSTTPKKEDDYADVKIYSTDKRNEKFDESSSIVKETTTTSIGEGVLATNPYTKSNVVATIANDVKNHNTVTDVVYATTKPVSKSTTKVTLKTTKATTKATTTTTTTTVPVTEPPVVETEPPEISDFSSGDDTSTVNEHSIYDICNKKNASKYFARLMELDITGDSAGFYEVNLGYGPTTLYHECIFTVYVLNSSYYVNDSVVQGLFKSFSKDEFSNDKRFLGMIKYAQDLHGSDIDYSKYTIDSSVGDFLNSADDAYRNGCFDEFINDKVVNCNAGQNILSNPGVMAILSSYSYSNCFSYEQIDASLDQLIDHICEITYGAGYSR